MLVDKQNELMSNLLFTVHQHGGDDVTWKPPIAQVAEQYDFFFIRRLCLIHSVENGRQE